MKATKLIPQSKEWNDLVWEYNELGRMLAEGGYDDQEILRRRAQIREMVGA